MIFLSSNSSNDLLLHISRHGRLRFEHRLIVLSHLGKVFRFGASLFTGGLTQNLSHWLGKAVDACHLNVFESLVLSNDNSPEFLVHLFDIDQHSRVRHELIYNTYVHLKKRTRWLVSGNSRR